MKSNNFSQIPRRYWMMGILLLASIFLSACGARSESWPGVSGDPSSGTVILSYNNVVTSLDGNRDRNWIYEYENAKFFAPGLLTDDTVFVGDFDGRFHAIDRETGEQVWVYAPERQSFLFLTFRSNNRVIAPAAYGKGIVFFGTERSIVALSADEGKVLWEFKDTEHSVWAQPLFIDGAPYEMADTLYVVGLDKKVYAIEPETGDLRWSIELNGSMPGGITLDEENGILFIGTLQSTLYAISLDGDILAEYEAEGWVWSPPVIYENALYFGDLNGYLYGLTFTDGEFVEEWKINVSEGALRGQPAIANGVLVIASEDKRVYAYNIAEETKSKKWENDEFDQKFLSNLAISKDEEDPIVVVATNDNKHILIALRLDDGKKVWTYEYKKKDD